MCIIKSATSQARQARRAISDRSIVGECDRSALQPVADIDIHTIVSVDDNITDSIDAQQRSQRASADDII
jgi:hypothetical protein